jgi:hypothetical protein
MSVVGIFSLILSLFLTSISWQRLTISRLLLSIALLFEHIVACFYNYWYALHNIADAWSYYYDPLHLGAQPWGLSTALVTQITHVLRFRLGATYLDSFLFFQCFSLAGVMLLPRIFDDIEAKVGVPERRGYWALLFLPSLHFWTVAIGKDAPLLLGISLAVWSMLNLRRRFPFFCSALFIMVLFRAHIALMAVASLAAATFFDSTGSTGRKIGLLAVALSGLFLVLGPVQQTIDVDVTSASSVEQFVDKHVSIGENFAGTTSIGHASFPVKAFSLLFRPFFFDANSVLGVAASSENILVVLLFIYLIARWRDLFLLTRRVLFIRFVLLYAALILLGLAVLYYNIGLGLRQRVMVYPMIYSVLVAMWSLRSRPAQAMRRPVGAQPVPKGIANTPVQQV